MNLDRIIEETMKGSIVKEADVLFVLEKLKEILYLESNLLLLRSPLVICGDVHGQLDDLIYLFKKAGGVDGQQFLFLGDYVDRGYFGLNTFLLLACYKVKYQNNFHMLRGNHEDRQISQLYGFYNEILANYGHSGLWYMCNEIFDYLPLAAIIDDEIFAVHGGLSPSIQSVAQINKINRACDVPEKGPLADLLWSDPDQTCKAKAYRSSGRGSGYTFGSKHVELFLNTNRLKRIVRSHQLADKGYQYYFDDNPDGKLLLIWSAPNYCYKSNNRASVLKFNFSGKPKYDIVLFDPSPNRISRELVPIASSYFA